MPRVAYSDQEREQIKKELVEAGLELMAKQGRYYQMWQAQAKYYQEEQEMQERFGQQVFA